MFNKNRRNKGSKYWIRRWLVKLRLKLFMLCSPLKRLKVILGGWRVLKWSRVKWIRDSNLCIKCRKIIGPRSKGRNISSSVNLMMRAIIIGPKARSLWLRRLVYSSKARNKCTMHNETDSAKTPTRSKVNS